MTSEQTIDGVSRDLIERVNALWPVGSEFGDDGEPLWLPHVMKMINELRSLLDKPAPEPVPVAWMRLDDDQKAIFTRSKRPGHSEPLYAHPTAYRQSVPAAQPQGEVERLRAEVKRLEGLFTQALSRGADQEIELNAKLAERDALLREASQFVVNGIEFGYIRMPEADTPDPAHELAPKIDAALSTSAEPKLRGEAVHQWSDDDGISWCDGNERSLQSASESGWKTRTLYAEQPAPSRSGDANEMVAKVVLPFAEKVIRKLQRFQECADDGQGADIGRHWFDLLTQLGLLNRVQRSPALWEITQQGEDALEVAKLNGINP